MGLFDFISHIESGLHDAGNIVVKAAEAAGSEAVGIGTAAGEGITTYTLAAGKNLVSAGGDIIDWSKTSADSVRQFTIDCPGRVADFSVNTFNQSVSALQGAWDELASLLLNPSHLPKLLPIGTEPQASNTVQSLSFSSDGTRQDKARIAANTILFPGFADQIAAAAVSRRQTYIFQLSWPGIVAGLYVNPTGQWGFLNDPILGFEGAVIAQAAFFVYILFNDNVSEAPYIPLEVSYGSMPAFGLSVLVDIKFRFLGFRLSVSTPNYLNPVNLGGVAFQNTLVISGIRPAVGGAINLGLNALGLHTSSPSLRAACDVASRAQESGTPPSNALVEEVRANALAAVEVGSPIFLKYTAGLVPSGVGPGIAYRDGAGASMVAQIAGKSFLIGPGADLSNPRRDRCISIQDHSGGKRCLTLNINGELVLQSGQNQARFDYLDQSGAKMTAKLYAPYFLQDSNGDFSTGHAVSFIDYLCPDGSHWRARLDSQGSFLHAPNGDFSQGHPDTLINYKHTDGTNWWARIETDLDGNLIFRHAKGGDWTQSSLSRDLPYRTWENSPMMVRLCSPMLPAIRAQENDSYFEHKGTPRPDLVVTSIRCVPPAPVPGDAVRFYCTIKAIGQTGVPAGTSISVGYAMDGSSQTGSGLSCAISTGIAAGASVEVGPTSSAWGAVPGPHSIRAWVDDGNRVAEAIEFNNSLDLNISILPPSPYLMLRLDQNADEIQPDPSTGRVIEPASTLTSVEERFLRSDGARVSVRIIGDKFEISSGGQTVISPILEYMSWEDQLTSARITTNGMFEIKANLRDGDWSGSRIGTLIMYKRWGSGQWMAQLCERRADLVLTAVRSDPPEPKAGDTVRFYYTIKNNGVLAAPAGASVGIAYAVDGVWQPGLALSVGLPGGLAPAASVELGPTTAAWTAAVGAHTIAARLDSGSQVVGCSFNLKSSLPDGIRSASGTDKYIYYLAGNGQRWAARLDGQVFVHGLNGDFSGAHRDTRINYTCSDGSIWWARLEQDPATGRWIFRHSPNWDFSAPSHLDTYMAYRDWHGNTWNAYPYFPGMT